MEFFTFAYSYHSNVGIIMKRTILLILFAILSITNIDAQLVKEKQVEDDGFVWYKTHATGSEFYGAEDESGKTIIRANTGLTSLRYEHTNDSFGAFCFQRYNEHGVYSKDGKILIPASRGYSFIKLSKDGFFSIEISGKKGACNLAGKEIIPPSRDYEEILHMGRYFYVKRSGKAGACDLSGKEIISPERGYDHVRLRNDNDNYYEVMRNNNYGICTLNGDEIISPDKGYDSIFPEKDYFTIGRNYKFGACDLNGNEIVPPMYSGLYYENGDFKYTDNNGRRKTVYSSSSTAQAAPEEVSTSMTSNDTSITPTASSQSTTRQDYVPQTPVFDGYYTMTGVYQSGGQWFTTGITSLTYFRVYYDEMYEGKGTYAYHYVGNEMLDNMSFRRYGTSNDDYFLVTFDGLIRKITAFSANYPMLGVVRTVNVNYYDQGDTRSAYTQHSNDGGGSYKESASNGTTPGTVKHPCGLCESRGWIPTDEGVTDFGNTTTKWCEDCRKYVKTAHWHKPCPSCGGRGYW